MATITSTGVGSGLDVNSIVTSLMALEKRPLTMLQTRASTIQTQLSAFGSLKSQTAALGDVASRLVEAAAWQPMKSESSDANAASASLSAKAQPGKYTLEVQALAQAQALASAAYSSPAASVGSGTITLEIGTTQAGVFTPKPGTTAKTVTIDPSSQSLADIRDAINAASAGVTASIVTSGSASRLVLTGADGAANSVRVGVTDTDGDSGDASGLSALAWDPAGSVGSGRNLVQTRVAQDARYTLNGLELTSATNAPENVIEGVSLSLRKQTTAPVDITVSVETVAVRKNINDFVAAYNSLNKLIKAQTQADGSASANGPLQGDFTARSLMTSLRDVLHGAVTGASPSSLSSAGIELQRDGSLLVNDAKLTPLLQTPEKLQALFAQPQTGTDLNSRGMAVRFKAWATALTGDSGTLASRSDTLSRSITQNQKQQDGEQEKLTRTEARLRAQYQRLDSSMSSLNAQMAQMKSALGIE